ncbi:hypothetical protein BC832DRAFT_241987 [Gaertneriomyces semiglobifer]|nr:hypothetical protein BC832DRAFT_241987 [Gaertneriomyces semiglobifer]
MDDEEICRVCRGGSTPSQPLYHPCKCSGSMRYVHQECLEEWLGVSGKRGCEICGWEFRFENVYAEEAPQALSPLFLLKVLLLKIFKLARFYARILLATVTWLVIVPLVTVHVWRIYFSPSALTRPTSLVLAMSRLFAEDGWKSFMSVLVGDVFEGQVIAAVCVVVCLAGLCLKEYVVMQTPLEAWGQPMQAAEQRVERARLFRQNEAGRLLEDMNRAVDELGGLRELARLGDEIRRAAEQVGAEDENNRIREMEEEVAQMHLPEVLPDRQANDNDNADARRSGTSSPIPTEEAATETGSHILPPPPTEQDAGGYGLPSSSKDLDLSPAELNISPDNNERESTLRRRTRRTSELDVPGEIWEMGTVVEGGVRRSRRIAMRVGEKNDEAKSGEKQHGEEQRKTRWDKGKGRDREVSPATSRMSDESGNDSDEKGSGKWRRGDRKALNDVNPTASLADTAMESTVAEDDHWLGLPSISYNATGHQEASISAEKAEDDAAMAQSESRAAGGDHWLGLPLLPSRGTSDYETSQQTANNASGSSNPAVGLPSDDAMTADFGEFDVPWDSGEMRWLEERDEDRRAHGYEAHQGQEIADNVAIPNPVLPAPMPPQPHALAEDADAQEHVAELRNDLPPPPPFEPLQPFQPLEQAPRVPPLPAPAPAAAAAEQDAPPPENDLNAFLELLGIDGPISNLLQNVAMVIFVIVVCIGVGGWLPYVTGRAVAGVGEPCVGFVVEKVESVGQVVRSGANVVGGVVDPVLEPVVEGVVGMGVQMGIWRRKDVINAGEGPLKGAVLDVQSGIVGSEWVDVDGVVHQEEGPETVNNKDDTPEFEHPSSSIRSKILYTFLGYLTQSVFLLAQFRRTNRFNHPYFLTLKRILLRWCSWFLTASKFTFFLTIELGLFPFFCGVLIDYFTMPVFGPAITISTRLVFHHKHPVTSVFLHWLAGTVFMFAFALWVGTVRELVRPGVLWFIRDPNDPEFRPVEDIIERPVGVQLRKLGVGCLMYAGLVAVGVGGFVQCVRGLDYVKAVMGLKGVMQVFPVEWAMRRELVWEFPVDLVVGHFFVPWVVSVVNPKTVVKVVLDKCIKILARVLELEEFLLGAVQRRMEVDGRDFPYLRVPNHDHIEVVPGYRMVVPMREQEEVFGREGETEDDVRGNWRKVYVPPMWKLRVVLFLVGLWVVGIVGGIVGIVGPVLLGRTIFKWAFGFWGVQPNVEHAIRDELGTHDVYAFLMGVAVCVFVVGPVRKVWNFLGRRMEYNVDLRVFARVIGRVSRMIGVLILGVGVVPMLMGVVFETYMIVFLRLFTAIGTHTTTTVGATTSGDVRNFSIVRAVVQAYTLGLIYLKIVWGLGRALNMGIYTRVHRFLFLGNDNLFYEVVRDLVVLSTSLFMAVVMPAVGGVAVVYARKRGYFGTATGKGDKGYDGESGVEGVMVMAFIGFVGATVLRYTAKILWRGWKSWGEKVREETFLVGRRLENLGQAGEDGMDEIDQEREQREDVGLMPQVM